MIARLHGMARLLTGASALWILLLVMWNFSTGAQVSAPVFVIWLFIGGAVGQLALWLASKMAQRT